jgi:protein-L-isoaspartate(D-aspartate) O-methyltransferase
MTQALNVQPRDKVLEVGTGSGYQAAILSKLARRVYTIDRHSTLTNYVEKLFINLNINNVTTFFGDGCLGLPEQAPFDKIMVTAAAEDPPNILLHQLKVGGIMIVPVGQSDSIQNLIKVVREESGFVYEELFPVRFVPLVEGLSKK